MKKNFVALFAAFLGLILGVWIGWFVERSRVIGELNNYQIEEGVAVGATTPEIFAYQKKLNAQKYKEQEHDQISTAIATIQLIDSGNTQEVVRLFTLPITEYYDRYRWLGQHDPFVSNMLFRIEALSKTNQYVATQLRNR